MIGSSIRKSRKQSGQDHVADQLDLVKSITNIIKSINQLSTRHSPSDRKAAASLLKELESAMQSCHLFGLDYDSIDSYIQPLKARL